jgi:hypothetical protein
VKVQCACVAQRPNNLNADRLLLFLLIILLSTNIFSGSYDRNANANHQNAESKVHQTNALATVESQRAATQQMQTTEDADYRSTPMNTYQAWSLILTALIVYITAKYTQAAYLQLGKLTDSVNAARRSAKVAERSLTELEVPCVSIAEIIPHILDQVASSPTVQKHPWIQYSFRNDGRSFAKLTSVFGVLRPYSEIPLQPEYTGLGIDHAVYFIGPNSTTGKVCWRAICPVTIGEDDSASILQQKTALIFCGFVRYEDAFRVKWISGFGWRWYPHDNGVYLMGDDRYNYARKDEEKTGPSEAV